MESEACVGDADVEERRFFGGKDGRPFTTGPLGRPVEDTLSWALDLLDKYDARLEEIDGPERVYTEIHVQGKMLARRVLDALHLYNEKHASRTPAAREAEPAGYVGSEWEAELASRGRTTLYRARVRSSEIPLYDRPAPEGEER